MVNTEAFGKRIEKIMNHYSISASSFADAMGVGRSSISHILSGRNKPSLDFVMRIIEAYPEVSLQWLLYNEGTFPLSSNMKISETSVPSSSTLPVNATNKEIEQDLFSNSDDEREKENERPTEAKENPPLQNTDNDERIDKIVILYKDGTFLSYTPK